MPLHSQPAAVCGKLRRLLLVLALGVLAACQAMPPAETTGATAVPLTPKVETAVLARALVAARETATATPSTTPAPAPTATVTVTAVPPEPTLTPRPTHTPTPVGPCRERIPTGDLETLVTLTYGLSKSYEPQALVPLADHLPREVTLGYPTEVRADVLEPLVAMITAMQDEGLRPFIQSGYRSYIAQSLAWQKWNRLYPETAAIVSAPPGHSEHQLGTAVDFGSPELAALVGIGIEFHTEFARTSEGIWLAEHAHEYGFTMSYTRDTFEVSGFYYEPWHFRYVGREMAQHLRDEELTLTEFLLANNDAPPCIPE